MNEIFFLVEDAIEGGYNARAIVESIYTQGETLDELKFNIRDAVQCHFDEDTIPKIIRLHLVREEVITV
jgi:predicted RNase H-like HicB family nuclease